VFDFLCRPSLIPAASFSLAAFGTPQVHKHDQAKWAAERSNMHNVHSQLEVELEDCQGALEH
jgi:hypothetical protein